MIGWMSWSNIQSLWSHIPVLGPLAHCSTDDHKSALKEFSVVFLFSTATFWLTALLLKGHISNAQVTYLGLIGHTTHSGELFIFSVAFLGPILITASEDPKNAREFPGRIWHILALVFLAAISAGLYAEMRAEIQQQGTPFFDKQYLWKASILIAIGATVLRYLAIVYRRQTFNPEKRLKETEASFSNKFSKHHQDDPAESPARPDTRPAAVVEPTPSSFEAQADQFAKDFSKRLEDRK